MFDRSRIGPEREHAGIGFERWMVDPVAGGVERRPWSDRPQEFPRCDERLTSKPYRYAYSIAVESGIDGARQLLRHDLRDGSCLAHDYGPGRVTGEAVFVPRGAAAGEDEGWLLSYVYDHATDRSDLVILDAQDFAGEPRAIVHLPARVPLGFHGNWIADAA
jgi:carotenoid cleavage dioxygenase